MESKEHGQNWLLLVLAVGLVATSVILASMRGSPSSVGQQGSLKDTLSVSGQGMITAKPDQAELYIQIETKGSTAYQAQTRNKEDANRVMDALQEKGVKKDDMETVQYFLDEEREWQGDKMVTRGYVLRHTLKVTAKDVEGAGELLDAAIRAGANGVERVSFTLSKEKQKDVNAEALKKATDSAREKAEAITDAAGVRLGRINSIAESNVIATPYEYYPMMERAMVAEDAAPMPTQIRPGDITVNAYIGIVYDIG